MIRGECQQLTDLIVDQQPVGLNLSLSLIVVLLLDAEDGIPEGEMLVINVNMLNPLPRLIPLTQVDGGIYCQIGNILTLAPILPDKLGTALQHQLPITHLVDTLDLRHDILVVVARLIVLFECFIVVLELLMPTHLRLNLMLLRNLEKSCCRLWLTQQRVDLNEDLHLAFRVQLEQLLAEVKGVGVGESVLGGFRQKLRFQLRKVVLTAHELSEVEYCLSDI